MELREYTEDDADGTRSVFTRAVSTTAARDYTPQQARAWINAAEKPAAWHEARTLANTSVAIIDGQVVGFIDVDDIGHIDMLFVEPTRARSGIATALLGWAKQQATALTAANDTNSPFERVRVSPPKEAPIS